MRSGFAGDTATGRIQHGDTGMRCPSLLFAVYAKLRNFACKITAMQIRTPQEIAQLAAQTSQTKTDLTRRTGRLCVLGVMAGAYIALGGLLSVFCGFGFPEVSAANPAVQRILSGLAFPLGLTLIVVLGGELFTGNNALMMPALMTRKASPALVARNWTVVWLSNFVGAQAFMWLMVVLTGLLDAPSPWRDGMASVAQAKASLPWIQVFFRGIGANWLVCLALWLAMSGKTLTEKALGCWLPVAAFVILGFEHSIANMFFIPCGMYCGADVTAAAMMWNNIVPATLGNIAGGALFVGTAHTRLFLKQR